ncbi:hypothetical protein HELRODRAFT_166405 [Helobdella robusta]|uniref:Mitochondrial import inner membrane translocase subunit TIM50 n=1 Tax=Helobdella robusta TaxID=6412 RepID=T1EY35_HELRO|nr:hypothetical protein HELRODRAFT_166405 [Helobdella robusta]ESN90701.1 hypothetical protein HELRODRAFT_166405 [Helobdella robusta]
MAPAVANLSISFKKSDNNNVNFLLAPVTDLYKDKKCVVIDLDETLVHSSFQPVKNADFIIPVEIDGTIHQYADPVTDLLDKWNVFQARLFRESCVFHRGNYVKDLSRLGRDLNRVVIIDNSPMSYLFHPKNAVPVMSWFDDPSDRELLNLIPFFENLATTRDSVYMFLNQSRQSAAFNSASLRTIEAVSLVTQQATLTNQQATFHPTSNEEIAPLNDTFSPAPVVVVIDDVDAVAAAAGFNVADSAEKVAVVCNGDAGSKECNDVIDGVRSHPLHKGDGDQQQQQPPPQQQQQMKLQQPQIKVQSAEQLKQQQQHHQERQQNKAILRQNHLQQQQHSLPQPALKVLFCCSNRNCSNDSNKNITTHNNKRAQQTINNKNFNGLHHSNNNNNSSSNNNNNSYIFHYINSLQIKYNNNNITLNSQQHQQLQHKRQHYRHVASLSAA